MDPCKNNQLKNCKLRIQKPPSADMHVNCDI